MPSWNDLSHLWSTLTEVDTSAIREQIHTPLRLAILGSDPQAIHRLADLLRTDPFQHILASATESVWTYPLPTSEGALEEAATADLALIILPCSQTRLKAERNAFAHLRADNPALPLIILHLLPSAAASTIPAPHRGWRGATESILHIDLPDALDR